MGLLNLEKKEIPKITFRLQDVELSESRTQPDTRVAKVRLVAVFKDIDLWLKVAEKLDGLVISSFEDFKGEMINALKEELQDTEKEVDERQNLINQLKIENKRLVASLELAKRELDEMTQTVKALMLGR